ncbi:GNAT family N-acetyltransferase [Aquibacillus rhizosphaerae]|uniref:GNAT family N-acetyltransferase n=1 Tax=Aquibacillus rhizosphaerae TaxID=3051431 RepID=A0ABT7L0G7_9BACI|nr:GNAT family N-acetyltransferase [Aquibacillus sp. LR5S19]MDL4839263.1 GNAT family N-acetyltransferase [Aquibacillus sp. LR5S19]
MNPIMLDFPNRFETERLSIRLPLPGDGEAVYNSIEASIEDLRDWLPFAQKQQSKEQVEVNIREAHINFLNREDLRLLIFLKETGDLVGSSGLHRIDWNVPKFEIGYWIDSRFSGKGYMSEAVEGITSFAFDHLHAKRVEIRCDAVNYKSKAIPEKLNYQLEGILRNEDRSVDGSELRDTCVYAKIRD